VNGAGKPDAQNSFLKNVFYNFYKSIKFHAAFDQGFNIMIQLPYSIEYFSLTGALSKWKENESV